MVNTASPGLMRIGVDFDNTIAGYDRLFGELAVGLGYLEAAPAGGKRSVRDAVRQVCGDGAWQRLQALAYGPRMSAAEPMAGIGAFLAACADAGIEVHVVSHKTRFAASDRNRVDLRRAALDWLEHRRFLEGDGAGLARNRVHFNDTRADKLACIGRLGLSHFIDDLEEVFAEPDWSTSVIPILFDPYAASVGSGVCLTFHRWCDIEEHILGTPH